MENKIETNLKYIPLALFTLFSLKLLIQGGTLEQTLICGVLGAVSSFFYFKNQEQQDKDLQAKLSNLTSKQESLEKSLAEVNGYINGVKISNNMRNTGTPTGRIF